MAAAGLDSFLIRDPTPEDEAAWRRLWAGYVAFYEADVPNAVTSGTWARLLDPNFGMIGRLAERDGAVVGFTISVIHFGSWTLATGLLSGGPVRRSASEEARHRPGPDRRPRRTCACARLVAALLAHESVERDRAPAVRPLRRGRRLHPLPAVSHLKQQRPRAQAKKKAPALGRRPRGLCVFA